MNIKEISFRNMISNESEVKISFSNKFYEDDSDRFISSTVKDKNRSEYKEGVLNTIAIMGKNGSYKTSTLLSVDRILSFLSNFKKNTDDLAQRSIDIEEMIEWYETQNGASVFEAGVSMTDAINEYMDKVIKITQEVKVKKYIKHFYNRNAFNKDANIEFKVVFLDGSKEILFEGIIFSKVNEENTFVLKKQGEMIDLYKLGDNKLVDLKVDFASFEYYNTRGYGSRGRGNVFLKEAFAYLYYEYFNQDVEKLSVLLKTLDQSVTGIKFTATETRTKRKIFNIQSISREVGSLKENIDIDDLSSGTQTFIVYLYFVLKNDFIIIDELESSLHLKLVSLLLDIARQKDKQILFSTHSPLVIEKYIMNYELYINDVNEGGLELNKGTAIYRKKDSYINKYIKDLVSNISEVDMDFLKMEFYD